VSLLSTQPISHCPLCGSAATRIHSRYQRRLADLPSTGQPVRFLLTVRKFFCDVSTCPRKIFTERLVPFVAPWAVLATSEIRSPNWTFLGIFLCLSSLRMSQRECRIENIHLLFFIKGKLILMNHALNSMMRLMRICLQFLQQSFRDWTKPSTTSLVLGTLTDLPRSKSELVAENALLRQQLIILRRQVKRPTYAKTDRLLLVLLARAVRTWKQALFIVQPETLLRWHRQGFRLFWKYKSRTAARKSKISAEIVALIKEMARDNRLWGAERIRGELLKVGLRVCKRTIQTYMRQVRTTRPRGQNWKTFLHTHAEQIWACDFLPVTDLFFHSLFAFFIIELHSRTVIHVGVTRSPTDAWTAQQLREATAYGVRPKYLIRDNDDKFGAGFAGVAQTSRIEILTTPYFAPRTNAICERFLGSVRRECLDHLLIFQEKQLHRVLQAYLLYFNQARPHQGIKQQMPEQKAGSVSPHHASGKVISFPVLGGLHRDYRRSA
jgi:putative transposase